MTLIHETSISNSILAIKAAAQVSVIGEDGNQITWHDGNPTNITKEQILAKQTELQAAYDAKEYQRKRESEYPSIKDQLDKIYHEGIDKWKEDMIKPVKDKHPKA